MNTWKARQWTDGTAGSWAALSTTSGTYSNLQYGYTGKNVVLEIAFTATDGNYKTIALRWQNRWGTYLPQSTGNLSFRYKVLEVEDAAYTNPTASTAYDGTITISGEEYGRATVTFTRVKGFIKGRTYYIYIFAQDFSSTDNCATVVWGNYDGTYYTAEVTSAFVTMQGTVNIGNRKGIIEIWDGLQWRVGMDEVWDGTQWRIGG